MERNPKKIGCWATVVHSKYHYANIESVVSATKSCGVVRAFARSAGILYVKKRNKIVSLSSLLTKWMVDGWLGR